MESLVASRITRILDNIGERAERAGRSAGDVKLMAVTKTVPESLVAEALQAGVALIGENYVQEAAKKQEGLKEHAGRAQWHLIGRLQTNKARHAVKLFHMIQSLDRRELAFELDRRSSALGRITPVLIEVNTGGEAAKSGVPLSGAVELIETVAALENISLEGLMTIPPWFDDAEKTRPYFAALRELKERIEAMKIPRVSMRELSMGMTGDYEVAVEEGATIVRIGRGIFGERS